MPAFDTSLTLIASFLLGALVSALLTVLFRRRRSAEMATSLSAAEATSQAESSRRQAVERALAERLEALRELDRRLAVAEERGKIFDDARRELENRFRALASEALSGNSEQFLRLANQKLATERAEAVADLDERRQGIERLLRPLADSLERLDARTGEIERSRVEGFSRLDQQIRQLVQATQTLQTRTTSLTTALKGTRVGGLWGEIALRNIAQLAGMTKHCDFEEQITVAGGRRPDMMVRLPGDRAIAVDAKVPLGAYLEAVESSDPNRRRAALDRHVKALRSHVRTLADRSYAEAIEGGIDLVVLFLPGDPLLATAFERDPDLQADALREKVLIATPTTLVALLRTVAIYWQQSSVVENAELIAAAARDLYDRAAKFGEDLARVGRGLSTALDAFNAAVGSYDRRLLPMARRLEEMKVTEHARRRLDSLEPIDEAPRRPTTTPGAGD